MRWVVLLLSLALTGCPKNPPKKHIQPIEHIAFKFDKCAIDNTTRVWTCTCDRLTWEMDIQRGKVAHCIAEK